jgi:uncharacterized membrane protein
MGSDSLESGSPAQQRSAGAAFVTREAREGDMAFERVIFISDAIFAIAITLLALQIPVPELTPERVARDLPGAVLGMIPSVLVYALSFMIIGAYWVEHHRMFRFILRYDVRLIWLNLLFLLAIAFLPVASALVGRYPGQRIAVLFYAVSLTVTGLMYTLVWRYAASDYRIVAPDLDPGVMRYMNLRGLLPLLGSALSIGLAFISPYVAIGMWTLLFVVVIPLGHLYYRTLSRITGAKF